MKLYVGTYKKFNEGSLAGAWLDLNDYSDKEEFIEACLELHSDEEDPELMFQDCECDNDLEEKFYSESYIDESYWDYKEALANCSLEADVVSEYLNCCSLEATVENIEKAEEAYCGTWNSEADFAENEVEECGYLNDLPNWIACHIDWEGIARDLGQDYYYCNTNDGVAVFRAY